MDARVLSLITSPVKMAAVGLGYVVALAVLCLTLGLAGFGIWLMLCVFTIVPFGISIAYTQDLEGRSTRR